MSRVDAAASWGIAIVLGVAILWHAFDAGQPPISLAAAIAAHLVVHAAIAERRLSAVRARAAADLDRIRGERDAAMDDLVRRTGDVPPAVVRYAASKHRFFEGVLHGNH